MSSFSVKSLKDAALKGQLQRLRQTDNWTNWFYLARTYLFLLGIIAGAVWFDQWRAAEGWSLLWGTPVFLVAVLCIGAGQHQLSGLAHEGTHHILFHNRILNELVSDWFCLFPLFSSTHHYRLQHLAHHQFVNDPERDPDISQLQTSGHWLDFPVSRPSFLRSLLKQLWLPNLARFILVRAKYNATPAPIKGSQLSTHFATPSAARFQALIDDFEKAGPAVVRHLEKGWTAESIASLIAREQITLLVMGSVVRTGIAGYVIGNTAESLLGRVDCSVLAIKPEGFVSPVATDQGPAEAEAG